MQTSVLIFLNREDGYSLSKTNLAIMILTDWIEKIYKKTKEKGQEAINPTGTRNYGMYSFNIRNPDGCILSFGYCVL
ncbi:MAG: hypothetical protein AAF519_20425 [Bacteroidota bacterium]